MRRLLGFWWIVFLLSFTAVLVLPCSSNSGHLKITKTFSDLDAIRTGVGRFRDQYQRYPSTAEGLAVLAPGFFVRVSNDPWGNPYVYRSSAAEHFVVYSTGVDGIDEGGAGDDVTTSDKEYECSTYGVNCGPRVTSIALVLLLISGLVGLVRGVQRISRLLSLRS